MVTYDVAIIGAGIVGAACADSLTEAGASVVVIEPGIIGGGATAAGMGHIVVMDDSEAQFALTNFSRDLWLKLVPRMSAAVEFERRGTLWVAADEEELAAVCSKLDFYKKRRVRAQMLKDGELRGAEPNLRHGLAGGLLVPDDAVIYAPCAASWLMERAVQRGASLRRGIEVNGLRREGVTLADGSLISSKAIVCAAGAEALRWFPQLGMKPRKGHLAITGRYPGFVNHQLIELGYLKNAHGSTADSVAFNAQPRATGQVLIGSSRQFGATNKCIDPHMLQRMLARAVEYMPAMTGLQVIRTWTGFRAATGDSLQRVSQTRIAEDFAFGRRVSIRHIRLAEARILL